MPSPNSGCAAHPHAQHGRYYSQAQVGFYWAANRPADLKKTCQNQRRKSHGMSVELNRQHHFGRPPRQPALARICYRSLPVNLMVVTFGFEMIIGEIVGDGWTYELWVLDLG